MKTRKTDTGVGTGKGLTRQNRMRAAALLAMMLTCLTATFAEDKVYVIVKFNKNNPLWQANYHDHIIRDDSEFQRIKNYIDYNPAKWEDDSLKQ